MTSTEPDVVATVARRLSRVREHVIDEPEGANEECWAWLVELGHRIHRHRETALAELDALFRTGKPSTTLDGQTEGILVSFTIHPTIDRLIAGITQLWMPWLGKRFDAIEHRGDNTLLASARWPAKLLWPFYRMAQTPLGLTAFEFITHVEPSALDAEQDVLFIDYASVPGNPGLIIKSIRDELVQLVPGVHLGKMMWHTDAGDALLAYFALRGPAR